MSPEILNPESKVGTLNPNTFESGKFFRVNVNVLTSQESSCIKNFFRNFGKTTKPRHFVDNPQNCAIIKQ